MWTLRVRDNVAAPSIPSIASARDQHNLAAKQRILKDDVIKRFTLPYHSHGKGSLARWELEVTDVVGRIHRFALPTQFHLHSLPEFGSLFTEDGRLIVKPGEGRWRHEFCQGTDVTGGSAARLGASRAITRAQAWMAWTRSKCTGTARSDGKWRLRWVREPRARRQQPLRRAVA
jgi:hypothetical protein